MHDIVIILLLSLYPGHLNVCEKKIGKAWSIWWCNQMQFETRLHIYLRPHVTESCNGQSHHVGKLVEVCNCISNCVQLQHQIDQAFPIFLMYVKKHAWHHGKAWVYMRLIMYTLCMLYGQIGVPVVGHVDRQTVNSHFSLLLVSSLQCPAVPSHFWLMLGASYIWSSYWTVYT